MPVEHGPEEVVAEVVVAAADLEGPRRALGVEEAACHGRQERGDERRGGTLEPGAKDPVEEPVERVALPPPVHVAVAQRERTPRQDAREHARV